MTNINMNDLSNWFDNMDADTKEPQAFGFDAGITEATLTDVSLYESKSSSWTAVQFEFTDDNGSVDNGLRISISKKKNDGSTLPVKMWQRNVFQLMQPLLLSDKNYKAVLDLPTIAQGNAEVVKALQIVVDKLKVRVDKEIPENENEFPSYTFLKYEAPIDVKEDDGLAF